MSDKKTIGVFEIDLQGPWPVWVDLKCSGDRLRFSHHDIADLKHAVNEIEKHAKLRLKKDANQV